MPTVVLTRVITVNGYVNEALFSLIANRRFRTVRHRPDPDRRSFPEQLR